MKNIFMYHLWLHQNPIKKYNNDIENAMKHSESLIKVVKEIKS